MSNLYVIKLFFIRINYYRSLLPIGNDLIIRRIININISFIIMFLRSNMLCIFYYRLIEKMAHYNYLNPTVCIQNLIMYCDRRRYKWIEPEGLGYLKRFYYDFLLMSNMNNTNDQNFKNACLNFIEWKTEVKYMGCSF